MAGISATGLGSGIDISGLVTGLVEAERQPTLTRLASKEATLQSELSAVGLLKGALSAFQSKLSGLKDAEALASRTAKSSDKTIASLNVTNSASEGAYSLEITALASAQKLVSQQDYIVSEGTLEFVNASESFTVTLGENNNATLGSVRDAINNASDNFGLTATIININGSDRLVFTADDTGSDAALTITGTATSGDLDIYDYNSGSAIPDGEGNVTGFYDQVVAGADAQFKLDGQALSSASNTVEGVIAGVTLELVKTNADEPITLTVSNNSSELKNQIKALVDGYNAFRNTLADYTAYDATTQTAGALFGDSLATGLSRQIRSMLTSSVDNGTSAYTSLTSLGITTERDGSLKLDTSKLDAALNSDNDAVVALFSAEDTGVANKLDELINTYLASDGGFANRSDSINTKLEQIDGQRTQLDQRMDKLESRLLAQYNAMDLLVSTLNQTSSWLESTLKTLPGSYTRNSD